MFLGTVLSVTDLPPSRDISFLSSRKVRIRIDDAFGGIPGAVKEVEVLTGLGGGDCGVLFQPGDVYLVSASLGDDGFLHTSICSSTRKIIGSSAAVEILRQRREDKPVPSLAGQIAQYDRNFDGLHGIGAPKPLANIMVRVKGDGNVYETTSDGNGLYAFYNLPGGQYEFDPELPQGTQLSWYLGSDRPLTAFPVIAGACQEHDIEVFPSGSIQGRVLDSAGKLLPYAQVFIVSANQATIPETNKTLLGKPERKRRLL